MYQKRAESKAGDKIFIQPLPKDRLQRSVGERLQFSCTQPKVLFDPEIPRDATDAIALKSQPDCVLWVASGKIDFGFVLTAVFGAFTAKMDLVQSISLQILNF